MVWTWGAKRRVKKAYEAYGTKTYLINILRKFDEERLIRFPFFVVMNFDVDCFFRFTRHEM